MLKVVVTGCNGQLGSELRKLNSRKFDFTFIDSDILDFAVEGSIRDYFKTERFDAIINCAAYTAVDKAESELQLADLVNHRAVSELAKVAKEQKLRLIHISTDYVFSGTNFKPYNENDLTEPVNAYGKTKSAGEQALLALAPENSAIIRTSWLYSSFGNNFVKTMLRLGRERKNLNVIFDQVGTPTYARDLAVTILEMLPKLKNQKPEIYHFSNEGAASWFDFARAVFELSGIDCKVGAIKTSEYPTPALRPHYSLLDKSKIKLAFGIEIPYWKDSLKECLVAIEVPK